VGPEQPGRAADEFTSTVFDEKFVRAARIREPSARARMLAAQWTVRPPDVYAWRIDGASHRSWNSIGTLQLLAVLLGILSVAAFLVLYAE
jgi:hypothetical protein